MKTYKLNRTVNKLVYDYNRLHGAEATARVIEIKHDNTVVVEFKGVFCYSCGVKDWIEDFAYLALSKGIKAELIDYVELNNDDFGNSRIGVFRLNIEETNKEPVEAFDYE